MTSWSESGLSFSYSWWKERLYGGGGKELGDWTMKYADISVWHNCRCCCVAYNRSEISVCFNGQNLILSNCLGENHNEISDVNGSNILQYSSFVISDINVKTKKKSEYYSVVKILDIWTSRQDFGQTLCA